MNYYLVKKKCPTCGISAGKKHIGKSSQGWQFHFKGYIDEGIICFEDWIVLMNKDDYQIVDENEKVITVVDFIMMCTAKKCEMGFYNIYHNLAINSKEKEYLENRPNKIGFPVSCWKDDDGYSFSKEEFS